MYGIALHAFLASNWNKGVPQKVSLASIIQQPLEHPFCILPKTLEYKVNVPFLNKILP